MPVRLITASAPVSACGDLVGIGDVAFDEVDLAHRAQRAQEKAPVGMARRDLDAPAGPGQRPHRVAAQKAGAAENRDQIGVHDAPVCQSRGAARILGARY